MLLALTILLASTLTENPIPRMECDVLEVRDIYVRDSPRARFYYRQVIVRKINNQGVYENMSYFNLSKDDLGHIELIDNHTLRRRAVSTYYDFGWAYLDYHYRILIFTRGFKDDY